MRELPNAVKTILDEHDARTEHWTHVIFRFCVLGNAGGIAATLAFAGSLLARSQDTGLIKLPLVLFSIGLICGGAIAVLEYWGALHRVVELYRSIDNWQRSKEEYQLPSRERRVGRMVSNAAVFSLAAFVLGTIIGVIEIVVFI